MNWYQKLKYKLLTHPKATKWIFNLWPPFLGTGFRVKHITDDFRHITLKLHLRFYNRNFYGTQFGGSLFSMSDPFYTFMLLNGLGPDYFVCDKSASINFISLGRSDVYAELKLSDDDIKHIKDQTKDGEKYLPRFKIEVKDSQSDTIVAEIERTLYVRKKKHMR